jgi:hypothetical protein
VLCDSKSGAPTSNNYQISLKEKRSIKIFVAALQITLKPSNKSSHYCTSWAEFDNIRKTRSGRREHRYRCVHVGVGMQPDYSAARIFHEQRDEISPREKHRMSITVLDGRLHWAGT